MLVQHIPSGSTFSRAYPQLKISNKTSSRRNLKMVSESSEGRALPQNVGGRYDASEERHLERLVTKGSMKERVEDAVEESMMHWHAHIMDSMPIETARNQRLRSVIQGFMVWFWLQNGN